MKQSITTYLPALVILLAGQAVAAQEIAEHGPSGYKRVSAFDAAFDGATEPRITRHHALAVNPAQVDLPVVKANVHKPKIKLKIYKKPKVKIYKQPKQKQLYHHPAYKRPKYRHPAYNYPRYRAQRLHLRSRAYRAPHYRYAPKRYRRH